MFKNVSYMTYNINLGSLPPKWAGPWGRMFDPGGAPGLVMRPCMVEIDRNYSIMERGGLCGLCIVVCQFQGSMARTDGQTDVGDNHNEPVNSQLTLPTKHKLYVSGCGTIYTNCIGNYKTLRV
ncbi:hypothetical protein DPMN_139340 [Dreissena polymorpha]|uniref:Uncharacterized protein n=1 Tax=Dreissena polymorpha TaxID=45954 RepID=A0A9D4G8V3_DREPO|nr:hypothetical protein DPMN_139340 [Dreissena polymorpha]